LGECTVINKERILFTLFYKKEIEWGMSVLIYANNNLLGENLKKNKFY
jgi:hypothetical protein